MSQKQGDFIPSVQGGYTVDGVFHLRNWRGLSEWLRNNLSVPTRLVLPRSAAAPVSPVVAQIYFDTTTNKAYVWDGGGWNALW